MAPPASSTSPVYGLNLHLSTADLVMRFARVLAEKLADAETKYGRRDDWTRSDWMDECRVKLLEHVAKGDPRDVAAYCAFLWHHGEKTSVSYSGLRDLLREARDCVNEELNHAEISRARQESIDYNRDLPF